VQQNKLIAIKCGQAPIDLRQAIEQTLSDAQRSGRPPTITPEQQALLVAKACENRQHSGRPIARWTAQELAKEMVVTNAIPFISSRWVSGLLARLKIRPHRIDYWMFSKDKVKDPNFGARVGKIWCPLIRQTRNEEDTLENLDNVIGQDPNGRFRLLMDNLNTHVSESFVRYVAETIGYSDDLEKKDVQGIVQSVQSNTKFLTDPSHRILIIFTPRHCSWLNQIEMWFSRLKRKVTGAMSFTSIDHLAERMESFIEY